MVQFVLLEFRKRKNRGFLPLFFLFGAGNQNRTDDLVITNDVLYRLSHTSIRLPDDLYIIPHPPRFVNTFFENIFSFFHVFFLCLFGLFSF